LPSLSFLPPSLYSQLFAYFCIYETSNLSLEEVDELYSITTAAGSKKANAELRGRRVEYDPHASEESQYADENKEKIMLSTV